ncbi:hypothetical protein BGY98DRAFT_683515 [Russula aff. rugulosa BPL654]|nr:hypothetical protein BGY98DRAFT_683515 [Russula aff. rugulosa BPL654]
MSPLSFWATLFPSERSTQFKTNYINVADLCDTLVLAGVGGRVERTNRPASLTQLTLFIHHRHHHHHYSCVCMVKCPLHRVYTKRLRRHIRMHRVQTPECPPLPSALACMVRAHTCIHTPILADTARPMTLGIKHRTVPVSEIVPGPAPQPNFGVLPTLHSDNAL